MMTSGSTFVENLKGWQLWTEFKAFRFVAVFKQPLWKAFWVAVILGTFAAFVIQSVYILIDYFHYNIDTVVQLKSVKGLPFPAVTICSLNPIRKSAMDYVEELSDLQTIYNYLTKKKVHASGNDSSYGTSRKKRSAHQELSLFHELYDDVPIIAEPYVKKRPKRQSGATCFLSTSGLTTSTMITNTTEAPSTTTTAAHTTTTVADTTTTDATTTSTVADMSTAVADITTIELSTTAPTSSSISTMESSTTRMDSVPKSTTTTDTSTGSTTAPQTSTTAADSSSPSTSAPCSTTTPSTPAAATSTTAKLTSTTTITTTAAGTTSTTAAAISTR